MQDNRISLETYLNDLPDNRVLYGGDERYIYDVESSDLYDYLYRLAISRNRYIADIDKIADDGYSIEKFKKLCINSCPECCKYENDNCVYDSESCSQYYAKGVTIWQELCGYNILFLDGKVPGTPSHPGPWNAETKFIIPSLKRILNSTILTLDSQPGLLVDDSYTDFGLHIQKPYIKIAGELHRLERILIKLFDENDDFYDARMIRYIDYGVIDIPVEGYINLELDLNNYGSVFLGIDTPSILTPGFVNYIFSNRFFDRIADVIETTP